MALMSGRMRSSSLVEAHLRRDRRLRAIDRGHHAAHGAREARVGQGVEEDLAGAGPRLIFDRLDSDTSASTSSVDRSAMFTTAPFESTADENGVTMSPTFALLVTTTPSNGARISVKSTATRALLALAIAACSDLPARC